MRETCTCPCVYSTRGFSVFVTFLVHISMLFYYLPSVFANVKSVDWFKTL